MAEVEENKVDLADHPAEHPSAASEQPMPTPEEQEAAIKKKYGGLLPKKPPLISKDHERAYFDSADWALGKGEQPGQKPKTLVEVLRPKLQPTHHQPLPARRASYETAENEDGAVAPSELAQEASEGELYILFVLVDQRIAAALGFVVSRLLVERIEQWTGKATV